MNIDGASNTHCYCPHENQCYNVTYIKWYCNTLNNTNVDKGCQLFNITHIFETGQTALLPYIFRRQFLCHEVNDVDAGKIDTIPYCSYWGKSNVSKFASWSQNGCETIYATDKFCHGKRVWYVNDDNLNVQCKVTHLTTFAVKMQKSFARVKKL